MSSKWVKEYDHNQSSSAFKGTRTIVNHHHGGKTQKQRDVQKNNKKDMSYNEIAASFIREMHNVKLKNGKNSSSNGAKDSRIIQVERDDNLTITFSNKSGGSNGKSNQGNGMKQKYQDRKSCINLSALDDNDSYKENVNRSQKTVKVARFRSQSPPARKQNINDDIAVAVRRNKKTNNQPRPYSMYNGSSGTKGNNTNNGTTQKSALKKGHSNYELVKNANTNNNPANKQTKSKFFQKSASLRGNPEEDKGKIQCFNVIQPNKQQSGRNIFTSDKWFQNVISSNEKKLHQNFRPCKSYENRKLLFDPKQKRELKIAQTDMADFDPKEDFNEDLEQYRLRIDLEGFTVDQPYTSNPILKIPISSWTPSNPPKDIFDISILENNLSNIKLSFKNEKQLIFNEADIKKIHGQNSSENNSEAGSVKRTSIDVSNSSEPPVSLKDEKSDCQEESKELPKPETSETVDETVQVTEDEIKEIVATSKDEPATTNGEKETEKLNVQTSPKSEEPAQTPVEKETCVASTVEISNEAKSIENES